MTTTEIAIAVEGACSHFSELRRFGTGFPCRCAFVHRLHIADSVDIDPGNGGKHRACYLADLAHMAGQRQRLEGFGGPANKADAVSIVHRICMGLAVTKR